MEPTKPENTAEYPNNSNDKLTSAEIGKLWASYMGNSMTKCIMSYFLNHVEDKEIKALLNTALQFANEFLNTIEDIFTKENYPIPVGFTDKDVNLDAPKLFEDEFYVYYLKYVGKAGMSIYNVAIPLMYRKDVKDFFIHCMNACISLIEQVNKILMARGMIIKPPYIPIPEQVRFVQKDFLNGFFGDVRPLHALEIAHLYDNIENNVTSKALLVAFTQVAKKEKVREVLKKGEEITRKSIERYMDKLHNENLPSPSFLGHLVTTSTVSPFSDKIMLFHKVDMFSMKIRAIGNSSAVDGRRDLGLMYLKSLTNISLFVESAAKLMIENGWFEQPPEAADRGKLTSK
ncbi:DUF3231 family protein [Cytobacillus depressus]|uniref:DUF3231 family protein n=1 Tax=Cytobacillus depressus TaxID=1602942 RepID=UPI001FEC4C5C|nr:DUF3231 family protein [Cytobacillus depressus]